MDYIGEGIFLANGTCYGTEAFIIMWHLIKSNCYSESAKTVINRYLVACTEHYNYKYFTLSRTIQQMLTIYTGYTGYTGYPI